MPYKALTTKDLANRWGVHRSTVACIVARLKVPRLVLGARTIRYDERDIVRAEQRMKSAQLPGNL
jgi:hypothetical protein